MSDATTVWPYIRGLENLSLCDWPGRMSCVIFLGGCNLHCPTCHNHALAWDHNSLDQIPRDALMSFLRQRAMWLDGVTITGGEPTTVPGIGELLWAIKRLNLPVKMDSNGMRPEVIRDILEEDLVTQFAVDVKGPYEMYPALTGNAVSAVRAESCLEQVFAMAEANPDRFYFRTTMVPGLTQSDIETCRQLLPSGFTLTLQDYVEPKRRKVHATADNEERRAVGNVVN